jgi:Rod binding domain-containing protein
MAGTDITSLLSIGSGAASNTVAKSARDQDPEHQRLRKATCDMEGWFVGMLLKKMHETAAKGGLFDQGSEAGMYREMFDEAVAKEIGSRGSFGIADALYGELAARVTEETK